MTANHMHSTSHCRMDDNLPNKSNVSWTCSRQLNMYSPLKSNK